MRRLAPLALHLLWIATAVRILVPSAADPDLWGHLVFGRAFLDGGLPSTNGFGYTAAAHPWVNHELLAEATMAALYGVAGAAGLVALKLVLGIATLAVVFHTAARRSRRRWAAAVATTLAAVTMLPGFMIRPQLFTLVLLAVTLHVLASARYRARGGAWTLPLVAIPWVNVHGGVLAGVGLTALALGTAAAVDITGRLRAGASTRPLAVATATRRASLLATLGRPALLVALLAAALLVNPYGPHLPLFLVTKVTPRVPITEWAPVAFGDLSFPLFKASLLTVALWTGLTRRARLPEVVVVAAAAAAALLHRRHIPLFAIVATPLVAAALADVARRLRSRPDSQRIGRVLRPGIAAVAALQLVLATSATLRSHGRIDVDPRTYPVQALRFLADNDVVGRVALPFDWGELALWALPPGSSVAVDGRFTTAYPQEVLDEAWRFMTGGPGWDDLLTRHPTDVVVSDRRYAAAQLLRQSDEWVYVYSDPVAVVFIRRAPSQQGTLERLAAGTLRYDPRPLDVAFPALARAAGLEPRTRSASATVTTPWRDS